MEDSGTIKRLVAQQLSLISDERRLAALQKILVEPKRETRLWDYGQPDERIQYWVVAEASEQQIILVYADKGFGPEFPWGFLMTNDPNATIGMDAQWNWYLDEAFVRSGIWPEDFGMDEEFHLPPAERLRKRGAQR